MSRRGPLLLLLFVSMLGLGCRRTPSEPDSRPNGSRATAPDSSKGPVPQAEVSLGSNQKSEQGAAGDEAPPPSSKSSDTVSSFRYESGGRIVAIGDLHGDFSATEKAFRLGKLIDDQGAWVGAKTVVVQTGDQLDRGDQEREILEFLKRISKEAEAAGGKVLVLNGNHETMNVLGDFRYVTPSAMNSFDDYGESAPLSARVTGKFHSRAAAFLPGGAGAQLLSTRPIIVMVDRTVFVHGGVLPQHVQYGIDRLNSEVSAWMRAERGLPPPPIVAEDGPVWTRLYGAPLLGESACDTLNETLELLHAERMVVGHTVQTKGVTSACAGKVYRIDVGLAHHYGDRPVQVLEITTDGATVLTEE